MPCAVDHDIGHHIHQWRDALRVHQPGREEFARVEDQTGRVIGALRVGQRDIERIAGNAPEVSDGLDHHLRQFAVHDIRSLQVAEFVNRVVAVIGLRRIVIIPVDRTTEDVREHAHAVPRFEVGKQKVRGDIERERQRIELQFERLLAITRHLAPYVARRAHDDGHVSRRRGVQKLDQALLFFLFDGLESIIREMMGVHTREYRPPSETGGRQQRASCVTRPTHRHRIASCRFHKHESVVRWRLNRD